MTEQIADQLQKMQGATTFHPPGPEGVWAVVDFGDGEHITSVYPTELEALRTINGRGYGRVQFVPWGKDLNDIDTEEARLAQLRTQLSAGLGTQPERTQE